MLSWRLTYVRRGCKNVNIAIFWVATVVAEVNIAIFWVATVVAGVNIAIFPDFVNARVFPESMKIIVEMLSGTPEER